MSSPVPDDADKRLLQALPWVSDPHRQDETRRLQEQVVEAAPLNRKPASNRKPAWVSAWRWLTRAMKRAASTS
jgi:hypothetical protein